MHNAAPTQPERNSFRIRFLAKYGRKSFRIRISKKKRGEGDTLTHHRLFVAQSNNGIDTRRASRWNP